MYPTLQIGHWGSIDNALIRDVILWNIPLTMAELKDVMMQYVLFLIKFLE